MACMLVFSFAYGFTYKSNDDKLHCKTCNGTYFKPSIKFTKFVGEGFDRELQSGRFYQCSDCGYVTDIKVK